MRVEVALPRTVIFLLQPVDKGWTSTRRRATHLIVCTWAAHCALTRGSSTAVFRWSRSKLATDDSDSETCDSKGTTMTRWNPPLGGRCRERRRDSGWRGGCGKKSERHIGKTVADSVDDIRRDKSDGRVAVPTYKKEEKGGGGEKKPTVRMGRTWGASGMKGSSPWEEGY